MTKTLEILEMQKTTIQIPAVKYTGNGEVADECIAEVQDIDIDCSDIECADCAFDPRNFPKVMEVLTTP